MKDKIRRLKEVEQARQERGITMDDLSKIVGFESRKSWSHAVRHDEIAEKRLERAEEALEFYDTFGVLPFEENHPRLWFDLTEGQYEAIRAAHRAGYYDVPRSTKLKELAAELGVSHQSLSQRLRRAHESLVSAAMFQGRDRAHAIYTGSAPSQVKVYHTTPDCPRLSNSDARKIDRERAEFHGLELCDDCPSSYSVSNIPSGIAGGAD